MFAAKLLTALVLAASTIAAPSHLSRTPFTSLSGWGGFSSLDGFDNFFGVDNFIGVSEVQTETVTVQQEEVVCHSIDITIIQQQLAVVREWVKKIITQQICEVETQTVVFSQFQAGIFSFGDDIRRTSNRQVSFDSNIAGFIGSIHDDSGEIVSSDLGFDGSSIGSHSVSIGGSNWNDATSPFSVGNAFSAAQSAASFSGSDALSGL